jgi:hypothetical protein
MFLYYVCPKDAYLLASRYAAFAHYLDLENGLILLKADFCNDQMENIFLQQPGVSALPHPLSGQTISANANVTLLQKHLPGLPSTATSFTVGIYAAKIHPLMGSRH